MSIKKYWDVARDGTGRRLGCQAAGENPWWTQEWESLVKSPREETDKAGRWGWVIQEGAPPTLFPNCLLGVFSTHLDLGAQRIRDHWF